MTPIFKEYCSYLSKHQELYGEKTVVLMQVGAFYEIYAMINDEQQLGEVNIYPLCQTILNIAVAHKTSEMLMAGFQMPFATKFIKLLIDKGYTVVLVHQTSEPPNVVREVTDIISPGTYIESYNQDTSNYMMSIYIEKIQNWHSVGISVMDVSTGENYVYQIPTNTDPNYWSDELNRFINYYSPKECLFQLHNLSYTLQEIESKWDVHRDLVRVNHYSKNPFQTIAYQNELFQKVFQFQTMLSPIEQLNLVTQNELRVSYVYMIQYIYDHKVDILRNIDVPQVIDDIHHLTLTSNSVRQLNVVDNYSYYQGKHESLYSICNECGFMGGKRLLKERLLYPIIDTDELTKRYTKIEVCQKNEFYKRIRRNMGKIHDLDRSLRKMGLGMIEPSEFLQLKVSYEFVNRVLAELDSHPELLQLYETERCLIDEYRKFWKQIKQTFQFHHFTLNQSLPKSYFEPGVYPELDAVEESRIRATEHLQCIQTRLNGIIEAPNACKVVNNDREGYSLYCTKKRSEILRERFHNFPNHCVNVRQKDEIIYEINTGDFTFRSKDKSNAYIESPEIKQLTQELDGVGDKLKQLNQQYWNQTMEILYHQYGSTLQKFHRLLADIDVSCSGAKIAIERSYCKPTFRENSKSCFAAKGIRHPIVEIISDTTEYVPNDVELGVDGSSQEGILLFGTNACGKSTLMKSLGLTVILAQAGLYVPCYSFSYKPYTQIFTRILNNDNLFRSQSTFAVEMMELRSIFQLANENSLILGDELCSGTETLSALSIVSSSLEWLSRKRASFMITSHLHQLNELSSLAELTTLRIYHLKIVYEGGILKYNRKLSEGPGPAIYGLKVCEAMGLPVEFIAKSNEILHQLTESSQLLNSKTSCYHPEIFMDECKVCGSQAQETHHIKEQCLANQHNVIDHHHKNKHHNLVPLCKECHSKVTYGGLRIDGWTETSIGRVLSYEFVESNPSSSKKYTQEQIEVVKSYQSAVESKQITKKFCMDLLDTEHGFRPSMKVLNDIFSNQY